MSGAVAQAMLPAAPTRVGIPGARSWLWAFVQATLFRFSLHNAYRWRRGLLRLFGATLAEEARIRPSARINCPWNFTMGRKSSLGDGAIVYANAPVSIGARSVISQYCIITTWALELAPKLMHPVTQPIEIGDDVWVSTESVVTAGSTIPAGVVVGARSVVDGPLEAWTVSAGMPARSLKPRAFAGEACSTH